MGAKQSLLEAVKLASDAIRYYDYEWYRPVIFMRHEGNEDGYLFEFVDSSETKSEKKLDEQQQAKLKIPDNIPRSGIGEKFFGREEELETLHQHLQKGNIVAITGMGGVGKTELAIQYAKRHHKQQTYPGGVCWVHVEEDKNREDPILGFEEVLSFAKDELNLQLPPGYSDLKRQIKYFWKHWPEGDVLLVVDNVTTINFKKIEDYLPPIDDPRFKVLITTRDKLGSPTVSELDLNELSQEAGLDLLKSLVGDKRVEKELEDAEKLCQWLGYLPLGLELVGCYLRKEKSLKIAEMLNRLEEQHLKNKALEKVIVAFELSWKRLDENQKFLGHLLSLFSSSPIPWFLVENARGDKKPTDLEEARHTLIELSLIKESDDNAHQLHPLIREFFKDKLESLKTEVKEEYKRNFCQAIAEVAREIPQRLTTKKILEFTLTTTHIQEATEEELNKYLSDKDIIKPFIGLGRFNEGQGLYSEAEEWYKRCLSTTEERLKKVCSDVVESQVVKSKNALAYLYFLLESDKVTESLYREALKSGKYLLEQKPYDKENALDVAQSQANLGYLYSLQKRYWRAKPLLESALKIRQEHLEKNSDIVISLSHLAYWYRVQNCLVKAQELYEKAFQMSKDFSKDEDENLLLAESYHNLATFYHAEKDYGKAEDLFREALRLNQDLKGEKNLGAADIRSALADVYEKNKCYDEAKKHYREALGIRQKLLGKHLDTVENLIKLGDLSFKEKHYLEAISWFYKTLNMTKHLIDVQKVSASSNEDKLVRQIRYTLASLQCLLNEFGKPNEAEDVRCQNQKIAKSGEKQRLSLARISSEVIAPVLKLLDYDSEIQEFNKKSA